MLAWYDISGSCDLVYFAARFKGWYFVGKWGCARAMSAGLGNDKYGFMLSWGMYNVSNWGIISGLIPLLLTVSRLKPRTWHKLKFELEIENIFKGHIRNEFKQFKMLQSVLSKKNMQMQQLFHLSLKWQHLNNDILNSFIMDNTWGSWRVILRISLIHQASCFVLCLLSC